MAETYDGTEGDDALAAGFDIMDGTESASNLDAAINKTRDLVAQVKALFSSVWAVASGGTGASNAEDARDNLGLGTSDIVYAETDNRIRLGWGSGRITLYVDATTQGQIANTGDLSARVAKSGDTMTGSLTMSGGNLNVNSPGHAYVPGATAATSSYTIAYINGDGRLSKGASSRRYKENITAAPDLGDLFPIPLSEFEMIGGDGTRRIGYIAEDLVGTDAERFVVYDGDLPDSIDFIALLLAQNAQLHARLSALEEGS